jgi:hypothetical protein
MIDSVTSPASVPHWMGVVGLLLAIILTSCSGLDPSGGAGVRQDTPEAAVRSYFDALDRNDIGTLELLTDPLDESDKRVLQGVQASKKLGVSTEMRDVRIQVVSNDGRTARLRGGGDMVIKQENQIVKTVPAIENFTAINKGGRWILIGLGETFPPGWLLAPQATE